MPQRATPRRIVSRCFHDKFQPQIFEPERLFQSAQAARPGGRLEKSIAACRAASTNQAMKRPYRPPNRNQLETQAGAAWADRRSLSGSKKTVMVLPEYWAFTNLLGRGLDGIDIRDELKPRYFVVRPSRLRGTIIAPKKGATETVTRHQVLPQIASVGFAAVKTKL